MFASARPTLRGLGRTAGLMARRGYAEEASASQKLKLTLAMPSQTIYSSVEVLQVNLTASSGEMGILANHVPSIEQLKPGVLEVIESGQNEGKKWFVSGGYANMHPSGLLTVNAVEAYPLADFSPENIRNGLAEAQRVAGGSGSEQEKAEARVEVEVYEALQAATR